jgi:hypothetical protein
VSASEILKIPSNLLSLLGTIASTMVIVVVFVFTTFQTKTEASSIEFRMTRIEDRLEKRLDSIETKLDLLLRRHEE